MTATPPARQAHFGLGDLLDILPDAVVMVDRQSRIVYVNPAVRELLGHAPAELLGQSLKLLLPPALRDAHEAMVQRYRSDGEPRMMGARPVMHAQHRSGRLVPVSISLCNQTLADGERVSVAVIHDVSVMKTPLDRATAMAETDALTGLGNRLRLTRRAQALLAHGRPFALLCLALADWPALSTRLGPIHGDEVLRVMAERLQRQVQDGDVVARLEGEVFAMMLDGIADAAALTGRAEALVAHLRLPVRFANGEVDLVVHVGASMAPRHGQVLEALLDDADRALQQARRTGSPCRLAAGPEPA